MGHSVIRQMRRAILLTLLLASCSWSRPTESDLDVRLEFWNDLFDQLPAEGLSVDVLLERLGSNGATCSHLPEYRELVCIDEWEGVNALGLRSNISISARIGDDGRAARPVARSVFTWL